MREKKSFLCMLIVCMTVISITLPSTIINASSMTKVGVYVNSEKEFIQEIYDNLLEKNKTFSIGYKGAWKDVYQNDLDGLFQKVYDIDDEDTSDDYDYMKGNIKKYSLTLSSNGKVSTFYFNVTYRETEAQTRKVNQQIEKVLNNLKLDEAADEAKVKKIHDYIVNRVTYDTSYNEYTAYQALIKKSAVCQGYALLFYKMTTEAGIPCRVITSSTHAWNIVKLGEKWYNVDTTWDDPVSTKPVLRYDYFLKGSETISSSHTMSAEFRTKAFKKQFPISTKDYEN